MILAAAWRRIRIPRRCHLRRLARYTDFPSCPPLPQPTGSPRRWSPRLHGGVAEGAGDDFGAAVVAVEAGLQNADWGLRHANVRIRFGARSRGYPPLPLGYFAGKWLVVFGLQGGGVCKILILLELWLKYLESATCCDCFRIDWFVFSSSSIIESWAG